MSRNMKNIRDFYLKIFIVFGGEISYIVNIAVPHSYCIYIKCSRQTDLDETAPKWAACSGYALFAIQSLGYVR